MTLFSKLNIIMDPIQINITIDLGQKTIEVIRSFVQPTKDNSTPARPVAPAPEIKAAPVVKPEPVAKKSEPIAVPEPAQDPIPDMPADIATEITDEQLRETVKKAKNASSPSDVRAIFAEFGIRTSIDCPQERRADLMAKLNKLAA